MFYASPLFLYYRSLATQHIYIHIYIYTYIHTYICIRTYISLSFLSLCFRFFSSVFHDLAISFSFVLYQFSRMHSSIRIVCSIASAATYTIRVYEYEWQARARLYLRSCVHLISLVTSGHDYIARDCHSNRQVKLHKNPGGKGGRRHADEPRTAKRRTIRRATAKGGSEPSRKPPAVFVKRLTPCNDCSHREDGRCSVRWHHCLSQGGSGGRIALRVPQLIEYCRILTITPDPFRILTITHERFNIKCTTLSVLMSTWNDTNDDACHQFYLYPYSFIAS